MCGRYTILWVDVVVYTTLFMIDGLELAMILVIKSTRDYDPADGALFQVPGSTRYLGPGTTFY